MRRRVNLRKAWNTISADYQAGHEIPTSFAHYGPHCPNEDELQLVGDVKGKHVLEIGCGGGQCSTAFAKRGAIATGIDLSDEQIEHARGLAKRDGVRATFIRGTMEDLSAIGDESQDVVFSAYALPYLERWDRCFSEVRRVLAPGGLFVFSLDHPFWACLAEKTLEVVRSYHDATPDTWDWGYGEGRAEPFEAFRRKLGEMFRSLRDVCLEVLEILEPEPVECGSGQDWGEYYSPERQRMMPATIIWKARKPIGSRSTRKSAGGGGGVR
jgi:ubiquinone/menaquinone biosynthesis C-methylase UbiE